MAIKFNKPPEPTRLDKPGMDAGNNKVKPNSSEKTDGSDIADGKAKSKTDKVSQGLDIAAGGAQVFGYADKAAEKAGLKGEKAGSSSTENGYKMPSKDDKAPPGMSAKDIIDSTPVLKNLGHQKDINREGLKKQVGDWENDPDPQKRADAAWKLKMVLEHIDGSKDFEGGDRSKKVKNGMGDGNIEGITKSGDARHGTEAGNLKDFSEKGYSALKNDRCLDKTSDTHVKKDGSNKDNFQWAMGEAGKYLKAIPILGKILERIGNSEGGLKGVFTEGLKGLGEGLLDFAKNPLKLNPLSLLLNIGTGVATQIATGNKTADPLEAIKMAHKGEI